MSITREFNLFLNAGAASPLVINANQYDQGEVWNFTLYSEKGIQYTPSTGAIVGIKSDNLGIINTGTVVDGKVVITETQQMTAAPGKAIFELMIDDSTHGTANFYVQVEPKPGNNADLSESDLSLIQQAIDSTNPEAIAQGVSDWMDDNLAPEEWVIDSSLSVSGAAADAKATGDAIAGYVTIIQHAEVGMPEYNTLKVTRPNGMISTVDLPMVTNGVISEDNLPDIGGGGDGLTTDIKQALLQIAQKIAYIDDDGQTYYTDLYNALYPAIVVTAITLNKNSLSFGTLNATQQLTATTTPSGGAVTWSSSDTSVATVSQTGVVTSVAYGNATITATSGNVSATCSVSIAQVTLSSISAVYTQSGTVYDTDSLDSLKADLVVTATWSNQTTSTVASADYTLSGTLTEGTSTITVSYGGKTTTFNVTVTVQWTFSSLTDGVVINGTFANAAGATCGMVLDQQTTSADRRRSFALTNGITDTALVLQGASYQSPSSQHSGYYPIPAPAGATQVKVSVTPNTQYIQVLARLLDDGVYSQMTTQGLTGYQQGSITKTFDSVTKNHAFFFVTTKYDSAGTSYPTEPTEIKVEFS